MDLLAENKLRNLIREELEKYDWGKEEVAAKPIIPLPIVYHESKRSNRESILKNGLKPNVGSTYSSWAGPDKKIIPAIFAVNTKDMYAQINGSPYFWKNQDIWAIDTRKINNEWFVDNHSEGMGFDNSDIVTFTDIPPTAIRYLMPRAMPRF